MVLGVWFQLFQTHINHCPILCQSKTIQHNIHFSFFPEFLLLVKKKSVQSPSSSSPTHLNLFITDRPNVLLGLSGLVLEWAALLCRVAVKLCFCLSVLCKGGICVGRDCNVIKVFCGYVGLQEERGVNAAIMH